MYRHDTYRNRIRLSLIFFALAFAGVAYRMFYLQVQLRNVLLGISDRIHIKKHTVEPVRGEIFSSNGTLMAGNLPSDILVMEKRNFALARKGRQQATLELLSSILEVSEQAVAERIENTKAVDFYLTQDLSESDRSKVKELMKKKRSAGLRLKSNYKRYYPLGCLAGSVLGFVNKENNGQYGVEDKFDEMMRGKPLTYLTAVDALSRPLSLDGKPRPGPRKGADIELTLDEFIQSRAEKDLAKACEVGAASAGCVVVMNPSNGELYALAQFPGFDPNEYRRGPKRAFRNIAVNDVFEPGSLAKIFAVHTALAMGKATPETVIDCRRPFSVGRKSISDLFWYKDLTVTEVLAKSVNVGTVKLALRCGKQALSETLCELGLRERTGIDLPCEASCYFPLHEQWSGTTIAVIPYGYEMTTTAVGICRAFAMFANGGVKVTPHVVKSIYDHRSERRLVPYHFTKRQKLARETTRVIADIMTEVVDNGTGRKAQIDGFEGRIAAKTGTAIQVARGSDGKLKYDKGKIVASIIGFFPVEDPQVLIGVHIWFPKGDLTHGGDLAGPVFASVGDFVATRLGIPRLSMDDNGTEDDEFSKTLQVTDNAERDKPVIVEGVMPDLHGMTKGEVYRLLSPLRMDLQMDGAGYVFSQTPSPGVSLEAVKLCRISFADAEKARQGR